MKKSFLSLAFVLASGTAVAGGLTTNTASNAAYFRFFAQEANITLSSLNANPAGSAFLSKGWHFGLSNQTVMQERNITTGVYYPMSADVNLPLLQFNPNYNTASHRYQGKSFAPIVPSLDFSYNSGKKWSINARLGLVGGGGSCEFLDGIGTFDALFAGQMFATGFPKAVQQAAGAIMSNPTQMNAIQQAVMQQCAANGISDPAQITQLVGEAVKGAATQDVLQNGRYQATNDSYMKGSNSMFGLQVGATYKVTDQLAVFAGVRGVYATANYNGYIQDAQYSLDGGQTYIPYESSEGTGRDNVLSMNCDQTGFGVSPILGIHWTINKHWNVAAKYEFKTRIRLENDTRMNDNTELLATQPIVHGQPNYALKTMAQFADGAKVADDLPGYLAVGTQYSPCDKVRIGLGYHWIQEKKATKYGLKNKLIDDDTHEILASAEWRCDKYLTISGGYQRTMFGVSDQGMNDISYNLSSHSIGFGFRIHPHDLVNIDLGYMHTFYQDRDVTTTNWMNSGLTRVDNYNRKNDAIGIALNFAW